MLELCRDARKNVCCDAHKKLCRDAKNILLTHLPVSDAGWSCDGRSVENGLSDEVHGHAISGPNYHCIKFLSQMRFERDHIIVEE